MYILLCFLYYKCITMYYMKNITARLPDELAEMLDTVSNKSDFIRTAIEAAFNKNEVDDSKYVTKQQVIELIRLELATSSKSIPLNNQAFVPKPPDPEIGYPCCNGRAPCKHWSWDGAQGVWVNELTGKTRDA